MSTVAAEKVIGGVGALPHEGGTAFRLWAPHADAVYVTGSFNNWFPDAERMVQEAEAYWFADVVAAAIGHEYRYRIVNGEQQLLPIDPYARQATNSVGNSVIHDPHFDWAGDDFHLPVPSARGQ